jgi:hypothetical protein
MEHNDQQEPQHQWIPRGPGGSGSKPKGMRKPPPPGMGSVYTIQQKSTGKLYVASTTKCLRDRWMQHLRAFRRYGRSESTAKNCSYLLIKKMAKHGVADFEYIRLIEHVPKDQLRRREEYWILTMGTIKPKGLNVATSCQEPNPNKFAASEAAEGFFDRKRHSDVQGIEIERVEVRTLRDMFRVYTFRKNEKGRMVHHKRTNFQWNEERGRSREDALAKALAFAHSVGAKEVIEDAAYNVKAKKNGYDKKDPCWTCPDWALWRTQPRSERDPLDVGQGVTKV